MTRIIPKPMNAVDLSSRYSYEERDVIAYMEQREGRPLRQEEINLSLAQAASVEGWPLSAVARFHALGLRLIARTH